jgi:hypothetical protein
MARLLRVVAVAAAALAFPAAALAGATYTLHPAGFGEHSFAAWKAQQGEPDSSGTSNQALYFQKFTTTATNAAGVAVIKGLEGQPLSALTGLAWDHRLDGHCGAGAPRWDLFLQDSAGVKYTVFLGCAAATHSPTADPHWVRDSYAQGAIGAQVAAQTPVTASPPFTIRGLAIVFDEGTDQGQGFVYLDNILVNDHCWTSASDNGTNSNATCTPAAAVPNPLATLDTLSAELLLDEFPNVPIDAWSFYNTVLQ